MLYRQVGAYRNIQLKLRNNEDDKDSAPMRRTLSLLKVFSNNQSKINALSLFDTHNYQFALHCFQLTSTAQLFGPDCHPHVQIHICNWTSPIMQGNSLLQIICFVVTSNKEAYEAQAYITTFALSALEMLQTLIVSVWHLDFAKIRGKDHLLPRKKGSPPGAFLDHRLVIRILQC